MALKIVTCAYNFPGLTNCESSTKEYFLLTKCLQNSPFVCHVPRLVQFRAEFTYLPQSLKNWFPTIFLLINFFSLLSSRSYNSSHKQRAMLLVVSDAQVREPTITDCGGDHPHTLGPITGISLGSCRMLAKFYKHTHHWAPLHP